MKKTLILVYDIPLNKGTLRKRVWRWLKKTNAELIFRSHWELEYSRRNLIELKRIREEIKKFGGKAKIVKGEKIE